jgi:hypothetical protein
MKHELSPFNGESHQTFTSTSMMRRDLKMSLCLLGCIVLLALSRIALQANWVKCIRVLLAFSVYSFILMALQFKRSEKESSAVVSLPFRHFALAAATAELVSGWLRPDARLDTELLMIPAAALLVGGIHWLALRSWRPLRERIVKGRDADATLSV